MAGWDQDMRGEGGKISSHLRCGTAPLGPQANWQSQVFCGRIEG